MLSVCPDLPREELRSTLVDAQFRKDCAIQLPATKIERIAVQACGDGLLKKTQFFPIQLATGALAALGRIGIPPFWPRSPPTQISPRW
jgi:hypothetical protein